MTATTPTSVRNLDIYGQPPLEWSRVLDRLNAGYTQAPDTGGPNRHSSWLATVRPDGRPHVAGVGALWVDGRFHFQAGPATQKVRNLAANPNCVMTVALHDVDVVVEGKAARVTDPDAVARIAARYAEGGWPCVAEGDSLTAPFSAPSAGPPPWHVYVITTERVYAVAAAEPYGATRWDF
jgi:hypothetical protein